MTRPRRKIALHRSTTSRLEVPTTAALAILVGALTRTFLLKLYVIPSASMEPTLRGGRGRRRDRILVDKISYRFVEPAPGDVVVFHAPSTWSEEVGTEPPNRSGPLGAMADRVHRAVRYLRPHRQRYVKRVIATAGQTVACLEPRCSITVDGAWLHEPYVDPDWSRNRQATFPPHTVPAGTLWVMGDNRNNSHDARDLGPVPVRRVVGRARMIVGPLSRFGPVR